MAFNCKTIIQYCFNIYQFKTTLWFLVNTDLTKNQILKARASKGKQGQAKVIGCSGPKVV